MFTPAKKSIGKGVLLAVALMLAMAGPALAAKEMPATSANPATSSAPPSPPSMPPMPPEPPMPPLTPPPQAGANPALEAAMKECESMVAKDKHGHPDHKAMGKCMKKKGFEPPKHEGGKEHKAK